MYNYLLNHTRGYIGKGKERIYFLPFITILLLLMLELKYVFEAPLCPSRSISRWVIAPRRCYIYVRYY